jgi:ubiquinone/menaquinone biosynthesis C-methylase UbiE
MEISNDIKSAYDNQYNDSTKAWRELGAKEKVNNITRLTRNHTFKKVLEVGSGDGSILMWLDKQNYCPKLYSVEISKSGIDQIEKRNLKSIVEIKHFSGYDIPYPDDFFDLVICSHVIEHVEFPRLLLREIKRVAKAHVFEVPIDFSLKVDKKINHFLSYGHINIYTPFLFRFLLKSEGFHIIDDKKSFYSNENMKFQYNNNLVKMAVFKFKRLIFEVIPKLKDIKPHTYSVFTKAANNGLNIMKTNASQQSDS